MPWSVRIEDETHRPISGDDVVLEFRVLDDLPHDFVMLRGVPRYQDTLFNSVQLEAVLEEWDRLSRRLHDPVDRAAWVKVRSFITMCLGEPHLYLKFIGD